MYDILYVMTHLPKSTIHGIIYLTSYTYHATFNFSLCTHCSYYIINNTRTTSVLKGYSTQSSWWLKTLSVTLRSIGRLLNQTLYVNCMSNAVIVPVLVLCISLFCSRSY